MAGNEQKTAVDGMADDTFSTTAGESGRRARAPLAVRIGLTIVAVLLVVAAALGGVNLYASSVYDQATESLNTNLAAYDQDDVDLEALARSQQQTDALFEDASAMNIVLLAHLRNSIQHNAAISKALSDQIAADLEEQHGEADSSAEPEQSEGGENGTGGDSSGSDGLTDEQRRKIQELLDSNQQQNSPTPSPDSTNDDKNDVSKPW